MTQEANSAPGPQVAFNTLRSLVRARAAQEQCAICGAGLPAEHAHLLEPANRQIICVCSACALGVGERQDSRYRRIPRRVAALPGFRLSDAQWDGLMIPVGMAFFFRTAGGRVMAYYPGPAGATESLLDLATWAEIEAENPILRELEPDVEALLVNRVGGARAYYRVPIDICYELVGLIRVNWRGLSGGAEVWQEIRGFFSRLQQRSRGEETRA